MTVFLSYSIKDYFFAELAEIKLAEVDIKLWRDQGSIVPGTDWRQGIENGISGSSAVLIALSEHSVDSSYVTYEWAYAIGKGKPVIPIKLNNCKIHPKLETIQYLDFTVPRALPWQSLTERIKEIEETDSETDYPKTVIEENPTSTNDIIVKQILDYLNQRGFQMVSFDRIIKSVDSSLDNESLQKIVNANRTIFRSATIKGNKKGLKKIIP